MIFFIVYLLNHQIFEILKFDVLAKIEKCNFVLDAKNTFKKDFIENNRFLSEKRGFKNLRYVKKLSQHV